MEWIVLDAKKTSKGDDVNNLISIIIPVYNAEAYLQRCLNSVLSQTFKNLEIILIDDGSVDNSLQICREFEKKDDRIIVLQNPSNEGVSYSRNRGLEIAKGEYIGFVDADDWIAEDHFSGLLEGILKNDCEMSIAKANKYTIEGQCTLLSDWEEGIYTTNETLINIFSPCGAKGFLWNKLFLAEIIKEHKITFNPEIYYCEDLLFIACYLRCCKKIYLMSQATYYYWIDGNNTVERPFNERQFSAVKAFSILQGLFKKFEKRVRRTCTNAYLDVCVGALIKALKERDKNKKYISFYKKEIRKNSWHYYFDKSRSAKMKIYILLISISCNLFSKVHGKIKK